MRLLRSIAVAAALIALLSAPTARAANISVEIVTNVSANPIFLLGLQAGEFTPGEQVLIQYTFDDAATDTLPAVGAGGFLSALSQLDVQFETSGFSFHFGNPMSTIGTSDDVPSGLDSVSFSSASGIAVDTVGGLTVTSIALLLGQDVMPGGPADLVVNDRPVAAPFDFTIATFTVITSAGITDLLLEAGSATAVPEPSLAVLFGLSLISALRLRRR